MRRIKEEKKQGLTRDEQETIIVFSKGNNNASVFTYERLWQRHLETMNFKPIRDNGFGGKEYQIPKSMIKKPRKPKKLSADAKLRVGNHLTKARMSRNSLHTDIKSNNETPNPQFHMVTE